VPRSSTEGTVTALGMGGRINAGVGAYKMSPAVCPSQRVGVDVITRSTELRISLKCY
jgi:hypothetical protein